MSTKYSSLYSNGKEVSASQYITELICSKKASSNGKELPQKFWELKEWGAYFRQQIVSANALLRIYDARAIIRALNNPKCFKVYSLRAPQLDAIIQEEERKLQEIAAQQAAAPKVVLADITAKPRPHQTKPNVFSKLREIDGEEEGRK